MKSFELLALLFGFKNFEKKSFPLWKSALMSTSGVKNALLMESSEAKRVPTKGSAEVEQLPM